MSRQPPFLLMEAVEKDVLRLQAKPYAEISGLNVGTAEVSQNKTSHHKKKLSSLFFNQLSIYR